MDWSSSLSMANKVISKNCYHETFFRMFSTHYYNGIM